MAETRTPTTDIYGAFIHDIGERNPRILPDSELRLRIERLRDPRTPNAQKSLARSEVYDSVLRTIPFAIKQAGLNVPPEELVGEAFETIDSCINNFEPEKISSRTEEPVKFSSYVFESLKKKLTSPRSVAAVTDRVRLPQHAVDYAGLMRNAWEEFAQLNNRYPTPDEWYKATVAFIARTRKSVSTLEGITPETFTAVREHGLEKRHVRLGNRVGSGRVHTDSLSEAEGDMADVIPDPSDSTLEAASKDLLKEDIQDILHLLPDMERTVLELYFGIGLDEKGEERNQLTLEQVGRMLGKTKENVRKIELNALRKLRHPHISRRLRDYLDEDVPVPKSRGERSAGLLTKAEYSAYTDAIHKIAERLTWVSPRDAKKVLARVLYTSSTQGLIDMRAFSTVIDPSLTSAISEVQLERGYKADRIVQDLVQAVNGKLQKNPDAEKWQDVEVFEFSPDEVAGLLTRPPLVSKPVKPRQLNFKKLLA